MIRVDFGLHYSDAFENEAIALEELTDFIEEQYEDLVCEGIILSPIVEEHEDLEYEEDNNLSVKDKFLELGWEFEEI